MRAPLRWAAHLVAPVTGLVLFFVGWELWVRIADVRRLVLPPPSQVADHLVGNLDFYAEHAWVTLSEAVVGLAVGAAVGVVAGALMAHSRFVERAVLPVAVMVQVTPAIAYAPVVVLWLGFGFSPKVFLAALVCFIPFMVNATTGFRSIDPDTHELLRSVHASRWEVFLRLRVPHCLPYLFAALRISVGLALIGATLGEFFGSRRGLGNTIRTAQQRPDLIDQLWASIFALAILGVALVAVVGLVEQRVLRWHRP